MSKCFLKGKNQYETFKEAKNRQYLSRKFGVRLHIYRCFFCGFYHLTKAKQFRS